MIFIWSGAFCWVDKVILFWKTYVHLIECCVNYIQGSKEIILEVIICEIIYLAIYTIH